MFQPLFVAASGLEAFEHEIGDITHNLSNARTVGFKRGRLDKESLFYVEKSFSQYLSQAENRQADMAVPKTHLGGGVRISSSIHDFAQGSIEITTNQFDLAIQGEGFFQIRLADGSLAYSRAGNFHKDNEGNIVDPNGNLLEPAVTLPPGTTALSIRPDGKVFVSVDGQEAQQDVGQIPLVRFTNPSGLTPLGNNLYTASPTSGEAMEGIASTEGYGTINQFAIEQSNVDVIQELMRMTLTQRIFEVVSKAIQAYDGMLQSLNQIRA